MKKIEVISLAVILTVAVLLRFPLLVQGFFAFTYDQGRDLLAVGDIVTNANFTLIGPTTGLPGVFYGPWWYYFLSPIFALSGGDPLKIAFVFALIGISTLILLHLLLKKLTGNTMIALAMAATASMAQPFITASSQIWSPSLVLPLMIVYVFSIYMIFQKQKPVWYLALGLSTGLIIDSGAAFGIVLICTTLITSLFFKKQFFVKNFLYSFLGLLLILMPRIIFDLRNEFLITKSIAAWLFEPKIYQEKLTILERLINRADLFWLQFAQTFTQSKKLLGLVPLIITAIFAAISFTQLKKQPVLKFLILLTALIYLIFSFYPDAVWDYYLVGLPLLFITITAIIFEKTDKRLKFLLPLIILFPILNLNPKLASPFSITWQGDGAIYRNQKNALDDIQKELRGDYSLYVYTPARFDYPFDYLIDYYSRENKIDLPRENQKRFYLIIRDDPGHTYHTSGWYGDKVRNMPTLREKHQYSGFIIIEKHESI